jgi:hypothetical protein
MGKGSFMKINSINYDSESGKIFRFDDICCNADINLANSMVDEILKRIPDSTILYAVSPLVHNMEGAEGKSKQRVYPKILNAYSDPKVFYNVDKCGIPFDIHPNAILASHGMIHVDHRLLDKSAQEMSILVSCSLVKSRIFIPPFNKWNIDTEDICISNGIDLIKFEDGWKCAEYNEFSEDVRLWYLHHREFTRQSFIDWINGELL